MRRLLAPTLLLALAAGRAGALAADSAGENLREWASGPVRYIAGAEELKTFRRLSNDSERALFIARFWARRDPTPETLTNEYRQLFWDRVREANDLFLDRAGPGWRTDRGKIHVLYGPPTQIEEDLHLDTGGLPGASRGLIRWIYEGRPGGRTDVDPITVVAFVRDVAGEWRLSYDPRLTSVFFDALAVRERRYDAMSGVVDRLRADFRSPLAVMLDLGKLQEVPPQAQVLLEHVETIESYRAEELEVGLARYEPPATEGTLVVVTADASFVDPHVAPSALARFAHADDPSRPPRVLGEDSFKAVDVGGRRMTQGRLVLEPGRYQMSLFVVDPATAVTGVERRTLLVPPRAGGALRLSDLQWAERLDSVRYAALASYDEAYQVGPFQVVPRLDGGFRRGEALKLFFQVYGGQAPYRVSYRVEGRDLDGAWVALGRPSSAEQAEASQAWELATSESWPLGDYRIRVEVVDRAGAQVDAEMPFTLVDDRPAVPDE